MLKKKFLFIFLAFVIVAFAFADDDNGDNGSDNGDGAADYPPQAIFIASYMGNVDLVTNILASSPDKDIRSDSGDTPLNIAMLQRNTTVMKLLLDYGFDPNAKSTMNGFTPLHSAVSANNADGARLLLQYRADKNIKNDDGQTPLDMARKNDKRDLVLILIR